MLSQLFKTNRSLYTFSKNSKMVSSVAQRNFGAFVNHRDTSDNLEETPFEFTEENYEKIREKLSFYPDNYKHSAVIPVLFIA